MDENEMRNEGGGRITTESGIMELSVSYMKGALRIAGMRRTCIRA